MQGTTQTSLVRPMCAFVHSFLKELTNRNQKQNLSVRSGKVAEKGVHSVAKRIKNKTRPRAGRWEGTGRVEWAHQTQFRTRPKHC